MSKPTRDDLLREFSRGNFRHVNDTDPRGIVSDNYCSATMEVIERLAAAERELDGYKHTNQVQAEVIGNAEARVKELEGFRQEDQRLYIALHDRCEMRTAENAKLREALRKIANNFPDPSVSSETIAEIALKQGT